MLMAAIAANNAQRKDAELLVAWVASFCPIIPPHCSIHPDGYCWDAWVEANRLKPIIISARRAIVEVNKLAINTCTLFIFITLPVLYLYKTYRAQI